jgi:tetratricopeptide (TPR) repeat protein
MARLALGDADAAEKSLREAIAKDDQLAVAWLGVGQALVAKSKPAEAEEALRRAIELAPKLAVARLDLADLLVATDRADEAAALCEESLAVLPTEHKLHLKLANIRAGQKQYDASLEHFAAARELAPFVYSPEASLAIACYQLGDEAKADELLNKALATEPNDPVAHCFVGQIARRNEQLQDAREHLENAATLPLSATWPASHRRQFLTLVYAEQLQLAQQVRDEALARVVLTRWVELEPGNEGVKGMLKELGRE